MSGKPRWSVTLPKKAHLVVVTHLQRAPASIGNGGLRGRAAEAEEEKEEEGRS